MAVTITCPHCGKEFDMGHDAAEHIRAQVRTKEFDREVASRMETESARLAAEQERVIEKVRHEAELERRDQEKRLAEETSALMAEVQKLNGALKMKDMEKAAAVETAKAEAAVASMEKVSRLEADLSAKEREVEYYRDLKAKMSTKMVGETLEQHCEVQFNQIRMAAFPKAEFHKDNEVSAASGSKGDYIFREEADGTELVSIMFEMKNDMDTTVSRKKNEQFFKELDKDRREKGCEYAVLVTMLEPDSELYNQGIVDVSWQYPKMYVIRPQFFIPIITLLRNAAFGALEARRELARMKRQDMELTSFREAFDNYKEGFGYNLEQAGKRNDEAIEEIDKAIRRLEAAKAALMAGGKQLVTMEKKVTGMTVEKLCKDSPSVLEEMG